MTEARGEAWGFLRCLNSGAILRRSCEVAATLVGRGNLNQPLSESDLLRERVANNIGQASDQTVASLALTERIVVSVPADTEIYVILKKAAKESQSSRLTVPSKSVSQPNIDELRQLMQLQRELNHWITKPAPEWGRVFGQKPKDCANDLL